MAERNPNLKEKKNTRGMTFLLIISMIIWGISWPINKIVTKYAAPVDLAVLRYLMVVPFLLIGLKLFKIPLKISRKGWLPLIIVSVLMAFYSFLFMQGLKMGRPGEGGVIVTTLNPIMAYTIGIFISKRYPIKREFLGLFIGVLAGLVLLRIYENTAFLSLLSTQLLLLCALVWALASKFSSKSPSYGHPLAFTFWMYVFTLLFIVPFCSPREIQSAFSLPAFEFWFNLFFSSVVTTGLATTMYFVAVSKIGPEKASSFIFIVPLAAALASWIILEEKIMLHTFFGGMLGVCAVYVLNSKKRKLIN
jgi:drug/metabolite transporter (DMT)-like permease